MKVDIDFDEVLDQFCKEKNRERYSWSAPGHEEIGEMCWKLLDTLGSYESMAMALKLVIEKSDTLKDYMSDMFDTKEAQE